MKPITLIIGGDLAPTKYNYSFFQVGNIDKIINKNLLDLILLSDFRIFNLEAPLTDINRPIVKDGPHLIAPVQSINGIKQLNPTILGLANNHIMDQDEQGLTSTLQVIKNKGILAVGAGINLEEALKPVILEKYGVKIGVYACAENEFSIAGKEKAGANPFDALETPDHISILKAACDFVIVLYHGGKEFYRYPSPGLQKVCRKMVQKGADLIICQHSHCVGSQESYRGSLIIYGQGNFLFGTTENEFTKTGLLIKISISKKLSVDYIPICRKENGVELPDIVSQNTILNDFYERSSQISVTGFVEAEYSKYCMIKGQYYLSTLAGLGRIARNIDKLLNKSILKLIYSRNKLSLVRNHVECESHREILINYLKELGEGL